LEIEIFWNPIRREPFGQPYALGVHNSYSLGPDIQGSSQTNYYGAAGLDASPVSIFDLIAMAVDAAIAAERIMLGATAGRLMPDTTSQAVH